ncbi:MAG: hypothetical protein SWK76_09715 [Actinomycetota bacterium]|nr:hypothetical protein [Actinomycetota bacterium]
MMRAHQGVTRSYYSNPVIQSYFTGTPPEIGSGIVAGDFVERDFG